MSTYPDDCPVAATLDAVGDRWTLLIVRDLLRGIKRYGELERSLEPIAPNLLAGRLRRLEDLGLVTRERYSERPLRASYELTERGRALAPVIITLGRLLAERGDRGPLHRQLEHERPRGGLEPVEVLLEQERPAGVDADALEDAVAVEQPMVEHRDTGLSSRRPLAVDVRDHDFLPERRVLRPGTEH